MMNLFQVENVVMLSEYEQNLSKEKEWEPPPPPSSQDTTPHHRKLFRKWSLFRNPSTGPHHTLMSSTADSTATTTSPSMTSSPAREIPTFHNTARKLPTGHRTRNQITVIEE